MTVNMAPTHKPRYWLITMPRTASNMLVRILNLDGQGVRHVENGGYFFLKAGVKRFTMIDKPMKDWTAEEHVLVNEAQQAAFDTFQDYLAAADEEGQGVFVKEHAIMLNDPYFESEFTFGPDAVTGGPGFLATRGVERPTRSSLNLTSMPDEFLKTWNPTFLIRHPALMMPSLYRTCQADIEVDGVKPRPSKTPLLAETTIRWNKTLYDFYRVHFGEDSVWPVVLDADDIMTKPELVIKYAKLVGFDPDKLHFSWDKVPEEEFKKMSPTMQVMLGSILASSKVDTSKVAGNVDIDAEAVKWRSEFGEEGGRNLEEWVRAMMPDYLAMHANRLRLE